VTRRLLAPLLLMAMLGACAPRERLNANCEWTNDPPQRLDPGTRAGDRHLISDATIAEELAIRYADRLRGRRSGHFAGMDEYALTRERCMASLFAVVATRHGVRSETVREHISRRRVDVDLAVLVSFAAFYALACRLLARRLVDRFPSSERFPAVAATAVTSVMASAGGLMIFALWAAAWEMMRVGTTHLSYRGAREPWNQPRAELFVAGVGLFCAIALLHYLNAARGDRDERRS